MYSRRKNHQNVAVLFVPFHGIIHFMDEITCKSRVCFCIWLFINDLYGMMKIIFLFLVLNCLP